MGTTYSITVGWGFNLTEEDIAKLADIIPTEVLKEYGYSSGSELREDGGDSEVLEVIFPFRDSKFPSFDYGMSVFYDYYGDEPYYVYLKRVTKTYYGSGFSEISATTLEYSLEELAELAHLEMVLGRDIKIVPFAEMSVG